MPIGRDHLQVALAALETLAADECEPERYRESFIEAAKAVKKELEEREMGGIFKKGFRDTIPEAEATELAIAEALELYRGKVASTEIIREPAHVEAHEYLVKVVVE